MQSLIFDLNLKNMCSALFCVVNVGNDGFMQIQCSPLLCFHVFAHFIIRKRSQNAVLYLWFWLNNFLLYLKQEKILIADPFSLLSLPLYAFFFSFVYIENLHETEIQKMFDKKCTCDFLPKSMPTNTEVYFKFDILLLLFSRYIFFNIKLY